MRLRPRALQLAGLAEDATPHGMTVFRPPRETMQTVGAAEVSLETPHGLATLSWRYIESQGLLGLLRDKFSRQFEVNVSIPFQRVTQLHIPIPTSLRNQGEPILIGTGQHVPYYIKLNFLR